MNEELPFRLMITGTIPYSGRGSLTGWALAMMDVCTVVAKFLQPIFYGIGILAGTIFLIKEFLL